MQCKAPACPVESFQDRCWPRPIHLVIHAWTFSCRLALHSFLPSTESPRMGVFFLGVHSCSSQGCVSQLGSEGQAHAGSCVSESQNGTHRHDSRNSSMRMAEFEECPVTGSATDQMNPPYRLARNRPGQSISWSSTDHHFPPYATSKPLQILPTHFSLPFPLTLARSATQDNIGSVFGATTPPLDGTRAQPTVEMDIAASPGESEYSANSQAQSQVLSAGEDAGDDARGSDVVHQDMVIVHQDSVIVHGDSLVPDATVGQALGEGQESAGTSSPEATRTSSVSFSSKIKQNLHRHKSSNYSRLLDYRLDEWCVLYPKKLVFSRFIVHCIFTVSCASCTFCTCGFRCYHLSGRCHMSSEYYWTVSRQLACKVCFFWGAQVLQCSPVSVVLCRLPGQSDPLNVPEHLREESTEDLKRVMVSRSALSTETFDGSDSKQDSSAQPQRMKRANSNEIMAMLPDKLRSQAEHAQSLADSALNSFVIVNAALQRSVALADYVTRADVKKRMGNNFRVGMGFGLHAGYDYHLQL
jgi:hypothetical protein